MTHPASTWLASVTDAREADMAARAGAGFIDAKDPRGGALGALPAHTVHEIVATVAGRAPVSATVGDLADMNAREIAAAALDMAQQGVDIVKIGLFPGPELAGCIAALEPVARRQRLVGVLLADRMAADPQGMGELLSRLASAGWHGAMLDTADKHAGGLLAHLSPSRLAAFIALAREQRLHCGLAGSLRLADIPALRQLAPDWLGFRGALCTGTQRTKAMDPARLWAVAQAMRADTAAPAHQAMPAPHPVL